MTNPSCFFYAAVGARLTAYHVDPANATLSRESYVDLPEPVQYVWRHPLRPWLYAVSSNGLPGNVSASTAARSGSEHYASVLAIDQATGALTSLHDPVPLPSRPIHCSIDGEGRYLLVAYNRPSGLTVHPIDEDGRIELAVAQSDGLDYGIYGHQVMASPRGDRVILVARGNDATDVAAEDPGALIEYRLEAGTLTQPRSITPGDGNGYGFGPRHLDIHPNGQWAYISVERQNELQLFDLTAEGALAADARQSVSSLSMDGLEPVRQMACAVHVHPNGEAVYQVNRSDGRRRTEGWSLGGHGEDSLVVYAIGEDGQVRVQSHVRLPAVHVRTFSLDPTGQLLIASSIEPVPVAGDDGGVRMIPARIMLYRVARDGGLTFARSYDVDTRGEMMFWTGFVPVNDLGERL